MSATIWVKDYQDEKEIRRISGYRKIDIAVAILEHDGVEVTASETNRLMKYSKSGLCSIFHDDHRGKSIRVVEDIKHGGRYVREGQGADPAPDPADTLVGWLAFIGAIVSITLFLIF